MRAAALLNWLAVTVNPRYWVMMYPLNRKWDAELRRLLREGAAVKVIDEYNATIGPYTVWTENYPYAAFVPCESYRRRGLPIAPRVRPTRRTIRLAWRYFGGLTAAERRDRETARFIAAARDGGAA